MPSSIRLKRDDDEFDLPLVVGSEGEVAIDIGRLRVTTGLITLDQGYVNTGSVSSEITYLDGEAGIENLAHLIRAYFKLNGHHIQFNIVDSQTLRNAQASPEEYRDLLVRVAGYSDYFVDLDKYHQEEIIARTEQKSL